MLEEEVNELQELGRPAGSDSQASGAAHVPRIVVASHNPPQPSDTPEGSNSRAGHAPGADLPGAETEKRDTLGAKLNLGRADALRELAAQLVGGTGLTRCHCCCRCHNRARRVRRIRVPGRHDHHHRHPHQEVRLAPALHLNATLIVISIIFFSNVCVFVLVEPDKRFFLSLCL